jgi:hypothetical protein
MDNILKKQFRYVDYLDDETKDVISEYTGQMYDDFNRMLRNKEELKGVYKTYAEKLDKAFEDSPLTKESITVYRGISSKNFITDVLSYISTTYNLDRAKRRVGNNCCFLKILIPSGSKILPIENISEYPYEKEILLPRVGELIITNIDYDDKVKVYNLVYIPPKNTIINEETNMNTVNEDFDYEEWSEKLIQYVDEKELDYYGPKETANELIINYSSNKEVSDEALSLLVSKLTEMYDLYH